ncbi:hypothetical protein AAC387_Pa03g3354 [Persea americana]
MPYWKSSDSPSSSSSSDRTTTPSRSTRSLRDIAFLRSHRHHRSLPQPRLTRQRELRHLTDLDIRGVDSHPHPFRSSSVSANSTQSLSPSNQDCSAATRAYSAQPLPLPLPNHRARLRRDESVDFPAGRPSVGSNLDGGKKALVDSVEHIQGDNRLNVPSRNTSMNNFSSPEVSPQRSSTGYFFPPEHSPQRMSTGCFLPSPYMSYQGLQVWSAPELPATDMIFFSQTSPEKFPDNSGLHSLIGNGPGLKPRNRSGTSSPLHLRMSPECSSQWHGSNGSIAVHPLPLPPGAAVLSQPTFVHQAALKSEVSSMKSQWQKGKLIGSGTFGNVFVATNRETGALCAMKEVYLIPGDPKSLESMQQLEQEIKVLSQLKHQNIVQYYGSEIAEDRFYIYLEYVHPGSISKYIRDHCGSMTESVVRNFTHHILSGLAYLHSKKTIHRDIKGANLLVDSSGVVKLADFGMAKHLSGRAAALSLKGSPYWMAPEVMQAMVQNDSGYDLAVDIWSLGCTIIEMFTGKPPWSEFEGAAAMFKVLRNESPPIPETLSAKGKNFLQCCFITNPGDRPSATKLLEHPFVKNSHQQEMNGCIQAISRMKLMDTTQATSEQSSLMQLYTHDVQGKQSSNG